MRKVALSMRETSARGYNEVRDCISRAWLSYLERHGCTPFPIPNMSETSVDYLKEIAPNLLILTGGDDIGATPIRDTSERSMLSYAIENSLPVFGVCRGLQLINDHFGGHMSPVEGHVATRHVVKFEQSWQRYYGEAVELNSYHDNGIYNSDIGESLLITAMDDGGYVEALQHTRLPIVGVMWHPERDGAHEGDFQLMTELISRAS